MAKFSALAAKMPDQQPPASLSEIATDWCMRLHFDECSDADREAFQRWHDADPSHAAEYATICRIWNVSAQLPARPVTPIKAKPRRRYHSSWARAAVVVLACGAIWVTGWSAGVLPGSVRYYAAQDTRHQVILPDLSQVELNRNSDLLYLGYNDQRRVVLTDGEAYFDVQHNVEKPFVVAADNANVRVTGTHFNVWTAPQQTTVTLTQGAVQVTHNDQRAELTPGMQATLMPGRELQLGRVDPARASAWRKGKLMLDDISLRDALPLINRYLNTPLQLNDREAGELRFGGIYDTAELEQLVAALPQILPVTMHLADGVRLISSRSTR
ncbi:FecR family protein [Pseudomonas sp. H9]|uniref:FecR family protein n=1 Tax=Pseudomonas sp. H9 TaxID=483968 RepID=UPI002113C577|nr:FecR family protein [Pseudomonas sp. H9]